MSDLITRLQSFNRKEQFILLREALGGRTFSLEAGFRERLGTLIGVRVPTDAFVAMDYHLDWLQMALFLARTPTPPQFIPKGDVLSEGQEDLNANQMDIDLLVAFDTEAKTHLVLLEAKMETGWSNLQMRRKAKRLRQIFGDHPHSDVARPHFVLLSRTRPQRLEAGKWPAWMKRDGKPVWMELPRPDGLCKVTRCGEDGAPSQGGGFLRVDRLAGSTSHSHSVASASSTTFLETVEKLSPLMDALKSGEERLWHEYTARLRLRACTRSTSRGRPPTLGAPIGCGTGSASMGQIVRIGTPRPSPSSCFEGNWADQQVPPSTSKQPTARSSVARGRECGR